MTGGPPADFKGNSYEDPETGDKYYRISEDFLEEYMRMVLLTLKYMYKR